MEEGRSILAACYDTHAKISSSLDNVHVHVHVHALLVTESLYNLILVYASKNHQSIQTRHIKHTLHDARSPIQSFLQLILPPYLTSPPRTSLLHTSITHSPSHSLPHSQPPQQLLHTKRFLDRVRKPLMIRHPNPDLSLPSLLPLLPNPLTRPPPLPSSSYSIPIHLLQHALLCNHTERRRKDRTTEEIPFHRRLDFDLVLFVGGGEIRESIRG